MKLIVKDVRAWFREAVKSTITAAQLTVPQQSLRATTPARISQTVNQRLLIESARVVTVEFHPAMPLMVPVADRLGRLLKLVHCFAAAVVIAVLDPSTPFKLHSWVLTVPRASSRSTRAELPVKHCTDTWGRASAVVLSKADTLVLSPLIWDVCVSTKPLSSQNLVACVKCL